MLLSSFGSTGWGEFFLSRLTLLQAVHVMKNMD
jgi:hypothetical protein